MSLARVEEPSAEETPRASGFFRIRPLVDSMRRARRASRARPAALRQNLERARALVALADYAKNGLVGGDAAVQALLRHQLYREAVRRLVSALDLPRSGPELVAAIGPAPRVEPELGAALVAALSRDPERDAEEPPEALEREVELLAAFVAGLVQAAEAPERRFAAALRRLALRGAALLGLVAAGAAVVAFLLRPPNLAAGKPWRASSTWAVCQPERHVCGGIYMDVFFHTNIEDNPWLELDLGAEREIGRVRVRNRHVARDRAVPLVVEVSRDQRTWREVARRRSPFGTWQQAFAPVTARWVRLRVEKHSALHLESVEVYRR